MARAFIAMPFGTRNASERHGLATIDFDDVYRRLIQPALEQEGFIARRLDEVAQPGSVEHQFLHEILEADLMVADVSIPNGNVYYELGLRQAISNAATVLIAHLGSELPFDIRGQRVLFYDLTKGDLAEMVERLRDSIRSFRQGRNPIREFFDRIGLRTDPERDQVRFQQDLNGRIERCGTIDQLVAVWYWAKPLSPLPVNELLLLARKLGDRSAWDVSEQVLRRAIHDYPNDFEAHRMLGWHISKSGSSREVDAHAAFARALALNPYDPETLGMQGGLFKRQLRHREAADCYARGAKLSPASLYMRVNAAAMAVLSEPSTPEPGIALYRKLLEDIETDSVLRSDSWADLVAGESAFGIGEIARAKEYYQAAINAGLVASAIRSAYEQLKLFADAGFRKEEAAELSVWLSNRARSEMSTAGVVSREDSKSARTRVIVHLSDIHFGSRNKNGEPMNMHRFGDGDWSRPLYEHLADELAGARSWIRAKPDEVVMVISGDLTYQGTRDEFDLVRAFLDELCIRVALPKERVVLAPGNHDVHWPSAKISREQRFDNYIAFLSRFYGNDLFRKRYPALGWDLQVDGRRDPPHNLVGIAIMDDVLYVSLNSCVYETDQNHYGFVGGRQLQLVEDRLKGVSEGVVARVAVLHHHLHPFPEMLDQGRKDPDIWMDLSIVRDAGLVERRLEKLGFDLVLHGHKHKAQLRETLVRDHNERLVDARRLIVCGAGSTGVNGSELGNEPNHYETIEIFGPRQSGVDFVRLQWRELPGVTDADWSTRSRWVIKG